MEAVWDIIKSIGSIIGGIVIISVALAGMFIYTSFSVILFCALATGLVVAGFLRWLWYLVTGD